MDIPDTTAWSAGDFAIAYDGLHAICGVANGIVCQPRAMTSEHELSPGAALLDTISVIMLDPMIDRLMEDLEARVYPDAEQDDQRIGLLVRYWLELGVTPAEIVVRIAVAQSERKAA